MNDLSFVQSNDGWSVVNISNGKSYNFNSDHPDYDILLKALTDGDVRTFETHISIAQAVNQYVEDSPIQVVDGQVMMNGEAIHHSMVTRIIENMQSGIPHEYLLVFLGNLLENISYRSRDQGYKFLEAQGLPITNDGCFLAYKTVGEDYLDKYTNKMRFHLDK